MEPTSKKPDMKFEGNLFSPLKFSSLKYDMMWFDCFQKFMVSCSCISLCPFAQEVSVHHQVPGILHGSGTLARQRRAAC